MSSHEKKDFIILVEGTGHVVQHNYGPALKIEKDKHENEFSVIFTDLHEKLAKKDAVTDQERFIAELDDWKAKYINKSSPEGRKEYESLNPTVVFVATPDMTHVQLAFNWLSENHRCKHIFIEKPIDSSLSRARVLQFYSEKEASENEDPGIYAIDHYLARFIPFRYSPILKALLRELGGTIESLSFISWKTVVPLLQDLLKRKAEAPLYKKA